MRYSIARCKHRPLKLHALQHFSLHSTMLPLSRIKQPLNKPVQARWTVAGCCIIRAHPPVARRLAPMSIQPNMCCEETFQSQLLLIPLGSYLLQPSRWPKAVCYTHHPTQRHLRALFHMSMQPNSPQEPPDREPSSISQVDTHKELFCLFYTPRVCARNLSSSL